MSHYPDTDDLKKTREPDYNDPERIMQDPDHIEDHNVTEYPGTADDPVG